MKRETSPFVKDVGEITKSVSVISKIVEDQVEYVNDKVEWVKSKINVKTDSSKKSPLDNAQNLATNLKAVSKGVSTFVKEIKNNSDASVEAIYYESEIEIEIDNCEIGDIININEYRDLLIDLKNK